MEKLNFEVIHKFGSKGGDNTQFSCSFFVITDKKGRIYVSDSGNHRIQVFEENGQWKETIGSLGRKNGEFNFPCGIAFNSRNHMIIADSGNHRVQVLDERWQFLLVIGSKGVRNGQFDYPHGVIVDSEDNIVVVDSLNHRIQMFSEDGKWIKTIGKEGSNPGEFFYPWSMEISKLDGRIFVSDNGNHRIQVFSFDWNFLFEFGTGGKGYGQFNNPCGLALSCSNEYLFVCDFGNHRIQVFNSENGSYLQSYEPKDEKEKLFCPQGICISPFEQIIVTEQGSHGIHLLEMSMDPKFKLKSRFGGVKGDSHGQFNTPYFVTVDKYGNIYVSDYNNNRIEIFDSNGQWKQTLGQFGINTTHFDKPAGIAFNSKNHLIVVEQNAAKVKVLDENYHVITSFGSRGKGKGEFLCPCGVAVNTEDNIIIADKEKQNVQIFNSNGECQQIIGLNSEFNKPWGVVVCKENGKIYISDYRESCIYVCSPEGKLLTSIGAWNLNCPSGIVFSKCGKYLLVCDTCNRKVKALNVQDGSIHKEYGEFGIGYGELSRPYGICVSPSGEVIVTDIGNHSVQIFE
jgi:tripartite motif-containing protein 71